MSHHFVLSRRLVPFCHVTVDRRAHWRSRDRASGSNSPSESDSESSSSSPADRLVVACFNGDVGSAAAAVSAGACVNDAGSAPDGWGSHVPLWAAVANEHHDVVVWLLARGADPNLDAGSVLDYGICYSSPGILQLLIDAGGSVNRDYAVTAAGGASGRPPLFLATYWSRDDMVRVLLAQPGLDVAAVRGGKTADEEAREDDKPALARLIAEEVSGGRCRELLTRLTVVLSVSSSSSSLRL